MFIQKTCYSPAFKADFVNNKEFREVVKYAQENNCMRTLDGALNNIKKANPGQIRICHGYTSDGKMYSTFMIQNERTIRSVANSTADSESTAEASFDGILELGMLNRKFRSLFGVQKVEQNITPARIIKEYTV